MGKLKKRIRPSDITINIGKDASIPECPIPGERFVLNNLLEKKTSYSDPLTELYYIYTHTYIYISDFI